MTRPLRTALVATLVVSLVACAAPAAGRPATLKPFRSELQFERTLDHWHARALREAEKRRREQPIPPPPAPAPAAQAVLSAPMQMADSAPAPAKVAPANESITNNQVQGVDEGDIVKRAGDVLVVLRRGRLFTVRVGDDHLEPVASANAFGPDVDPSGTWYDEMLVSADTIAVIGYSYSRGGTEVGLFDLARDGGLHYRATYQLRSSDYYSSRNYASRLVGHKLVFYTPSDLNPWSDWRAALPAYRRWTPGATPASFHRMLPAERIYRGLDDLDDDVALHTVSVCDLATPEMDCNATAVLGGSGGTFYVSEDAVYVWTTGARNDRGTPSASVLRMPLDGGAPSMLRTWGSPNDQMAFLQRDGWLNVLVARDGDGDRMWRGESGGGDLALMRVPLTAFGDLRAKATRDNFRVLPGTSAYNLHQRFIGDWLVYGDGVWGDRQQEVHVLRYAATSPVQTFKLVHRLDRIDALGADGVLVGNDDNDLVFTGLRLRGDTAALDGGYRRPDATQGDDRTHGFFYRPQDADSGVLGLPILHGGERAGASVLYLRNRALALSALGTLDSHASNVDDACQASCVDWYGNARPIFLGDRVFALLGYELVEGSVDGDAIHERRRVDFAPPGKVAVNATAPAVTQ
ncbi:beta-propeller domain-containing protein [Cognatilysobacter terrigena]|uniref:beta-propeller domain-containing protein n=1 Tax=Cognatilysobacter terrigena TaxID=2488749 RepID=UPI0014150DA9|nr:beta-propeller domain-containing protein [Lysobacter terrigena]